MKKVVIILCLIAISACSSNDVIISKDMIYLNHEKLTNGEYFDLYFNALHLNNSIKNDSDYVARIVFIANGSNRHYLLKLSKVKNGLYKTSFQIPYQANIMSVRIQNGIENSVSYDDPAASFPIYLKDGSLSNETISYLYYNSSSKEEFLRIRDIEYSMNSNSYMSYFISCLMQSSSGRIPTHLVDSNILFLKSVLDSTTEDSTIRLNLLLTLNDLCLLKNDFISSTNYLDSIRHIIINKRLNNVDIHSQVESIKRFIFFQMFNHSRSQLSKSVFDSIVNQYIEIALNAESHYIEIELYRNLLINKLNQKPTQNIKNFLYKLSDNVIKNTTHNFHYYYTEEQAIFLNLFKFFIENNDLDYAERIANSGIYFEKNRSKIGFSADTTDYVSARTSDGLIYEHLLNLSIIESRKGNNQNAIDIANPIYNKFKNHIGYWKGTILCSLFNIYLTFDIIEAENKLQELFSMNDERKYSLLNLLNEKRRELNLVEFTMDTFYSNFSVNDIKFESYKEFNYLIDGKSRSSFSFKDTLVFVLNINDECPACNVNIPEILEILKPYSSSGKCKIIVISDSSPELFKKTFGKDVLISKRTNSIVNSFSLNSKNWTYLIIINNNVFFKSQNLFTDVNWYENFFNKRTR